MRTGLIVQARMGSTRFPGKMLADLAGKPLLQWCVDRLDGAPGIDVLVVATSDRPGDDAIAAFCEGQAIACFRGSEEDVLQRYMDTALAYDLDVVVRACGDAPLTDPPGIVELLREYERGGTRFVLSRLDYPDIGRTDGWPTGTAADLFTRDALIEAAADADQPHHREHVMPFFVEHPERFDMRMVFAPPHLRRANAHLAIDFPSDLDFLRGMFEEIGGADPARLPLADALRWLDSRQPASAVQG